MGAGHSRAGTELAPRICSAWRAEGSGGRRPGSSGRPEGGRGRRGARLGGSELTRRADRSMSSRLRAGAGSPMASAGNGAPGPLTLRLGYSAAAVAASPPSGDPGGGLHRASRGEPGGGRPAGRPTHRLTGDIAPEPATRASRLSRAGAEWLSTGEGRRGNVTRARRVPPPPRRRHLRAGAGGRAKGARED